MKARMKIVTVAVSAALAVGLVGAARTVIEDHEDFVPVTSPALVSSAAADTNPVAVQRPLDNDCSAGYVTFTFDDGPRRNTVKVLDALDGYGIDAVFFWVGHAVKGRESVVARAVAEGHVIGSHSFSHPDLTTGELPDGTEETVSDSWLSAEFEQTNEILVEAGAPRPTLYRPPYGAVNSQVDEVAQDLGLRLVMPWGLEAKDNIIDARDTEGRTTQQIIDSTVPFLRDEAIITMHDGQGQATLNSIGAFQAIVDEMNEKSLCATTDVRSDATGRVLTMYG